MDKSPSSLILDDLLASQIPTPHANIPTLAAPTYPQVQAGHIKHNGLFNPRLGVPPHPTHNPQSDQKIEVIPRHKFTNACDGVLTTNSEDEDGVDLVFTDEKRRYLEDDYSQLTPLKDSYADLL